MTSLSFVGRWVLPASIAGLLLALAGCGGNSAPPYNQTPAISLIVPSNITAGSQDFTLIISGTGFVSTNKGTSFAYWNGSARSTNYNLTTGQLQVTIPASDVTNPGSVQVTVINPPPGGGQAQAAATFQVEPAQTNGPTISSIMPASAQLNAKPPQITINGSNFVSGDVVTFNGQLRPTPAAMYVDQGQMTLQLSQTDTASIGSAGIAVGDSGLVLMSPSAKFAITAASAPSPTVSSLSPSSAAAGAADLQVLVKGSGYEPNSTVLWNSVPVATAYLNGSAVMALVPAADLATQGTADVSVMTPAPGGGTSGNSTFTVNAQ
ncbi:MAG: hypothetical protein ACRD5K_10100 [Candidatus Acidiferrales bacterium]